MNKQEELNAVITVSVAQRGEVLALLLLLAHSGGAANLTQLWFYTGFKDFAVTAW